MILEGEVKDAKMRSFSSDQFQTLIKHYFPPYAFLHFKLFVFIYNVSVYDMNIFRRWSVLYGFFDPFTDCPYGNAFLFNTYLKPLPLNCNKYIPFFTL